jgi:hypothetical protein
MLGAPDVGPVTAVDAAAVAAFAVADSSGPRGSVAKGDAPPAAVQLQCRNPLYGKCRAGTSAMWLRQGKRTLLCECSSTCSPLVP